MRQSLQIAIVSAGLGAIAGYVTGNPPSEKRLLGTVGALVAIGVMGMFPLTAGISDIFAWILSVLIWLNDGSELIKSLA